MAKRTKKSAHAKLLSTLQSRTKRAARQAELAKKAARHAKEQARAARKAFKELRKHAKHAKVEWEQLTSQLEQLLKETKRHSRPPAKRSRVKREG